MKFRKAVYIAVLIFFTVTAAAWAQEEIRFEDDVFIPDFTEEEMRIEPAAHQAFDLSWGGWITPTIINDRPGGGELMTSVTTFRLWAQASLWENAHFYVRGRNIYMRLISEDGYPDSDSSDNTPDLEAAYISMAFLDRTLNIHAGRRFFVLGSGIVFNGRGDGAELRLNSPIVDIKLFGLYTGLLNKDLNPYGISARDLSDGAKRIFAGGSVEKNIINHTVYLFGMAQIDQAEEESGEKNRYDSQYYGAGLKGILFDGMEYYGEFIYQQGTNSVDEEDENELDISAMAAIAGFNYYFDAALNPALLVQYAYGSGFADEDEDGNFGYFGTYLGGFALRPKLQNLHVIRAGVSVTPLSFLSNPGLNRMTVIGRYSYYMKDDEKFDAGGGIGATEEEKFVGHGIDCSVRWRIYHDLAFFLNYGYFIPGDAFPSDANDRSFVMAGLSLSF